MRARWEQVPPPLPKPRKVKKDPQRHKIYMLEREIIGNSVETKTSRNHLRDILYFTCQAYGVDEPELRFIHKPKLKEFGISETPPPVIYLNSGFHGDNTTTLLHELAHHIVDERVNNATPHGPEFVKVYMDLLHRYRIIPRYAFKKMLARYKVKYK